MKTENLEKILGSIDKKTLDSVLKERDKRAEKTEIKSKPAASGPVRYTEGKSSVGVRILKIVSVAAAVALIAALAYVCYLPIYMQEHGINPAAGEQDLAPSNEWIAVDYTDASKIKVGMTLDEAKAAIRAGSYTEGIPLGNRVALYVNDKKTGHVFFVKADGDTVTEVSDSGIDVNYISPGENYSKLSGITIDEAVALLGRPYRTEWYHNKEYESSDTFVMIFRFDEHTLAIYTLIRASNDKSSEDYDKFVMQNDAGNSRALNLIGDFCDPLRTESAKLETADKVEPGMTLGQICDILGKPFLGRATITSTVWWHLENGTMIVTFKNKGSGSDDPFSYLVCDKINILLYNNNRIIKDTEEEPADGYFNSFTEQELYNPDQNAKISEKDAEKIKHGMTYEQVVAKLGKPLYNSASGAYMMRWNIDIDDPDMYYTFTVQFSLKPGYDDIKKDDTVPRVVGIEEKAVRSSDPNWASEPYTAE